MLWLQPGSLGFFPFLREKALGTRLALIGQMSSRRQIRGTVDSIALFQYHASNIREKILNMDFEQAIHISLREFSLFLRLQEEQKRCLWPVA